jgi:hypothetical protein
MKIIDIKLKPRKTTGGFRPLFPLKTQVCYTNLEFVDLSQQSLRGRENQGQEGKK